VKAADRSSGTLVKKQGELSKNHAIIVFILRDDEFIAQHYSPSIFDALQLKFKPNFSFSDLPSQITHHFYTALNATVQKNSTMFYDFCIETDDTHCRFDLHITPLTDMAGNISYNVAIKHSQAKQKVDQQQYLRHELLVHNAHDCILVIDNSSKIQVFNKAAQLLFGYELHEVIGHSIEMLIPKSSRYGHSTHVKRFEDSPQQSREMSSRNVVYGLRKNGEVFPAEIAIAKMKLTDNTEFSAVVRDITQRAKLLEKLSYQAHTDALTGLNNRFSIENKLSNYISHANEKLEERPLCLMLIDLDNFKKVNDTHGHDMGDKVLCAFALTATKAMSVEHAFGRYGGEEFIIVVPEQDIGVVLEQAQRVRQGCERSWVHNINYTVSIGVAKYQLGESLQAFIQRADLALYQAKNDGRNRVCSG